MIPKFRAWVKPNILSNHLGGVIAEAKPDFLGRNCLVRRNDLDGWTHSMIGIVATTH